MGKFIDELKRRNVVRVGVAYTVVAWLMFQIGEVLFPAFGAPDWVFRSLILVFAIGFPFVLIFAWAFELTPDGVRKTRDVNVTTSLTASTGRKLNILIVAGLVIALGYFIWERQFLVSRSALEAEQTAAQTTNPPAGANTNSGPVKSKRSIAVLPFVNMSSDKEQDWFVDGLTEEILNSLARTPDLLVAARTSSFAYKGATDDVRSIAEALGVQHILEGSVRRSGDHIRVTAQLIRANDGFHLWSETYDRDLDDLIEIQEDVAVAIAGALQTAIDPEALASMVSSGTRSVPAYQAYLRGLSITQKSAASGDAYERLGARDAFEEAISQDPEFALAHWRLANFWGIQLTDTLVPSGITELATEEMLPFYEAAIDKAIEYQRDNIVVLLYRADKAYTKLKFRQALRLLDGYLEQRPNDQQAQLRQILLLSMLGSRERLSLVIAHFYETDGFDPAVTNVSLTALLNLSDAESIRDFAANAVDRFKDNVGVLYQAHRDLLWSGDIDGASKIMPLLLDSDLPATSLYLVSLRQACTEQKIAEARRIFAKGNRNFAGNDSIIWLGHRIMGQEQFAVDTLMPLDDAGDMRAMTGYLAYSFFDPRPFPNLMAFLQAQGIERGEPPVQPYRCPATGGSAS
jgi:TolB-like protein